MKKMASMQVYMASDPASRQALDRQMITWDENLEKLHIEQYQLRCYLAALQGADLPSTKVSRLHLTTVSDTTRLDRYSDSVALRLVLMRLFRLNVTCVFFIYVDLICISLKTRLSLF